MDVQKGLFQSISADPQILLFGRRQWAIKIIAILFQKGP
jgi:hypothetical protein